MPHFSIGFYKLALKWQHNPWYNVLIKPLYSKYAIYRKRKRSQRLHKIGPELMSVVFRSLLENGVDVWLEFGSLLGAIRERNFIPHDEDIDVGVFFSDRDKIHRILTSSGLKLFHEFVTIQGEDKGIERTYIYKGLTIDFMFFHLTPDGNMYCNTFGAYNSDYDSRYIPVKQIYVPYSGFKNYSFKDINVRIPTDYDAHLKAHYGENYMIPDSKFDYRKSATNIVYFSPEERSAILKKHM